MLLKHPKQTNPVEIRQAEQIKQMKETGHMHAKSVPMFSFKW